MKINNKGFTLIELMITIGLLVFLVGGILMSFWTDKSLDQLLQITKDNPNADMPFFVAIIVSLLFFPLALLFNIVMMFV